MQGKSGLTGDVGGMHLAVKALDAGSPISRSTYLAALGAGVCRSKNPSRSNVAVVSRCMTSKPCPTSVRQYCPL